MGATTTKYVEKTLEIQWRSQPKGFGGEMFDFRQATVFFVWDVAY